jgi:hypothetical protein
MNFVEQLSAIALLVDFLFGIACGVIGGASHGSRREGRGKTLLQAAPDPVTDGARVIHGVYIRDDDGYLQSLLKGDAKPAGNPRRDDSSGSHRQDSDR